MIALGIVAGWLLFGRDGGDDDNGSARGGDGKPAKPFAPQPIPPAGKDPGPALTGLDVSAANRRAPLPGLYDWSKAGFRSGAPLPGEGQIRPDAKCRITPDVLAKDFQVAPNDGKDDTDGLQRAVDRVKAECSPTGGYDRESLIQLPSGQLDFTHEVHLDADYLVLRGAGSDPATGTRMVYRPDKDTLYDVLSKDGSRWDQDKTDYKDANGGWLWPGRGLLRVQSRAVHPDYAKQYADAPANRKDLYEGTVNVHWKAGLKLREKPGGAGFAARTGDTVVPLANDAPLDSVRPGTLVNVRAANSRAFYEAMNAAPPAGATGKNGKPDDGAMENQHMRQQIFTVTAVDAAAHTITLDKPLEYDVPVTSVSDGSAPIQNKTYDSKVAPLVDPVLGVGVEAVFITQDMPKLDAAQAVHNYGNMDPAAAMHGIVFKWAADSWVKGVDLRMTGSHPIVTEEAAHLSIVDNVLEGAWNKGKGGNGYLRGSRVWDSLYAGNTSRGLRHFTFQWSASGNVVIGNSFDSDLNLHGGWERNNLFELNKVAVPAGHRPDSCRANCGDEGGSDPDNAAWYPIWWAAGQKAVKWSGASGPDNVFFRNEMTKQTAKDGPYTPFYDKPGTVYRFGWDGKAYKPLSDAGKPIADWAGNETKDFTAGQGVDTTYAFDGPSIFLNRVG
ncbi:hypothetical protein [Yinghuangia seranimata]|uniref:hypothetical protein n=1 Tax=Yinghuangia seranimata TaxID=408067 RepID=UPI00248AA0D1|nr:hypothetical protein [Yinghuangia seranimata]MDI2129626.1 hypothetical protein [Yinghuangia seranimata]